MASIENPYARTVGGMEFPLGQRPPVATLMDLLKPEYRSAAFGWFLGGRRIELEKSPDMSQLWVAPDASHALLLLQSEDHAPDNIEILSPEGAVLSRPRNPYLDSKLFRQGDWCEFDNVKIIGNRVYGIIHVRRDRPGLAPQEPHYAALFDASVMKFSRELEFLSSKDW